MKKAKRIVAVVLWAFAGLFFVFSMWALVEASNEVSKTLIENDITLEDIGIYEAVKYVMGSFSNYLFYALTLTGLGFTLCKKKKHHKHNEVVDELPPETIEIVEETKKPDVTEEKTTKVVKEEPKAEKPKEKKTEAKKEKKEEVVKEV